MVKINKDEETFEYDGEVYPLIGDTEITPEEMDNCIKTARCAIEKIIEDINDDK